MKPKTVTVMIKQGFRKKTDTNQYKSGLAVVGPIALSAPISKELSRTSNVCRLHLWPENVIGKCYERIY